MISKHIKNIFASINGSINLYNRFISAYVLLSSILLNYKSLLTLDLCCMIGVAVLQLVPLRYSGHTSSRTSLGFPLLAAGQAAASPSPGPAGNHPSLPLSPSQPPSWHGYRLCRLFMPARKHATCARRRNRRYAHARPVRRRAAARAPTLRLFETKSWARRVCTIVSDLHSLTSAFVDVKALGWGNAAAVAAEAAAAPGSLKCRLIP